MNAERRQSLYTYLVLLAIAIATVFYGQWVSQYNENIRVWNWINIPIMLIGIPFILLQKEAGLPEVWQSGISNKHRLLIPALIGLFFGALDVLVIKIIMHPEPYESLPPFLQPFPYSIFLFISGAFEIEVFYRLLPLTLLLIVIWKWILKGKHFSWVFWPIAILTAIREPLEQWPTGATWYIVYAILSGFIFNLLQAYYFKKAGFISSMMVRLGHYLLWHILLGIYVEYVELGS